MSSPEDEIVGTEAVQALLTHDVSPAERRQIVVGAADECENCNHHPWHILTLTAARMVTDSPLPEGVWQWVWWAFMLTPVVEV